MFCKETFKLALKFLYNYFFNFRSNWRVMFKIIWDHVCTPDNDDRNLFTPVHSIFLKRPGIWWNDFEESIVGTYLIYIMYQFRFAFSSSLPEHLKVIQWNQFSFHLTTSNCRSQMPLWIIAIISCLLSPSKRQVRSWEGSIISCSPWTSNTDISMVRMWSTKKTATSKYNNEHSVAIL